nr:electron transfer flavoprotein subunit beta/FixA family protein [Bacteroidota bacterium]
MKILVCVSNVPDTTTKIKLSGDMHSVDLANVQWIINPWDELALTRALELKEASEGKIEKVTVMLVGAKSAEPTMRKALAIGADDAVRVDAEPLDAYFVAGQIAGAIKDENYDLVFCGIESSDYNGSAMGSMLSEFMNIPSVSSVSKVEMDDDQIVVNREIAGGFEVVVPELPFVAIVQKGITKEPRIPSMRGIMMARKKPLKVVEASGLEALTEFVKYEPPQPKAACKMIDADNVAELVDLLHNEAKII